MTVEGRVRAEIARRGPLPFSAVVEAALYGPGGFYVSGGRAGRDGDFLTSPEVGPLFGVLVARFLDREWRARGRPDPFVVVEAGAGPGTLARTVLAASPECGPVLRYVLVERSPTQRALHGEHLALEGPAFAFAPRAPVDDEEPGARLPAGGPIVVSLAELPRIEGPCVVLANELLDDLPVDLAERTAGGWAEVRVGAGEEALVEVPVPLAPERAAVLDARVPAAAVGARVPLPVGATAWLRDARAVAGRGGVVVALDYGSSAAGLAARPWTEWVRTYRAHERGGPPLVGLGVQDVTCEVPFDLLPPARSDRSQADWLADLGLEELVEEGRRLWAERAHLGDLAAVRARSRVGEAGALVDPAGLGAFRVLEWRA
ncbi:MAG: SAM-dependent methyltransferase [Acidimicrobiia bacterium]